MSLDIVQQPIAKVVQAMLLPTMAAMLITFMFQLVDTYFIGYLGVNALAATGLSYPLYAITLGLIMGVASGVTASVAGALGLGNQALAQKRVLVSMVFVGFVIVFACVIMTRHIDDVISLLGSSATTSNDMEAYLIPLLTGLPLLAISLVANASLMAKGMVKPATTAMAFSGLVNLLLDYIFIFGAGPIPAMGLAGAAWASALAWLVLFLSLCVLLIKHELVSIPTPTIILEAPSLLLPVLFVALPAMTIQALHPLSMAFVTQLLANQGDAAVAGFILALRIESLGMIGVLALSVIVTPIAAQNHTAGQTQRISQLIALSGRFVVYWGILFYTIIWLTGHHIFAWMTDDTDTAHHALTYFYWLGLPLIGHGLATVATGLFNGMSEIKRSMKLITVKALVFTLPLTLAASLLGIKGIWLGLGTAYVFGAIYAGYLIHTWQTSKTSENLSPPWEDYLNDTRYLANKMTGKSPFYSR